MNLSILHIAECPNWVEAGARGRAALDDIGMAETEVKFTLLNTSDEASRVPFAGSPTVLVDGVDLFPSDGRTNELACRVYISGGRFVGVPETQDIEDALRQRSA